MGHVAIEKLETELRHRFRQPELLVRAATHSSLAFEQNAEISGEAEPSAPEEPLADNEQLEFLGDAVLGLVAAEVLYTRFPELEEGDLTRMRATLVSRRHMGLVAGRLELGQYLRLGRGEERSGGRKKAVLLANALEAVIAALYLDGGFEAARAFVLRTVVDPFIDDLRSELKRGHAMGDHKSALQELLQARKAAPPEYEVTSESGPDHRKRFAVEVRVHGNEEIPELTAAGMGSTKKKAEQEAARHAYTQLQGGKEAAAQRLAAPEERSR